MVQWSDGTDLGTTDKEVEASAETWVLDRLKSHEFKPRTTYLADPGNKWRASSAMQKAIRRGMADMAIRMANAIHGLDPDYVWRRLSTVVLEDVGIGNIPLVSAYLWVAGKKAWRLKNGGDKPILYMLIDEMCGAVKDRHACDLLVLADLAPDLSGARKDLASTPLPTLLDHAMDEGIELGVRMLCAWYASGTKTFPSARLVNDRPGDFPAVIEAFAGQGVPMAVRSIMRWGRTRQYEGMPMAFPLVWQLAARSGWVGGAHDDLVQLPRIGGYPSEAFDMHNQEGKRAISYFIKACEPVHAWLSKFLNPIVQKEKTADAVGTLLFREEGHQVDQRLRYDGSAELLRMARDAHYCGNWVPEEHIDEGMMLFHANKELLHYARRKIVAPHLILPGEKPASVWHE